MYDFIYYSISGVFSLSFGDLRLSICTNTCIKVIGDSSHNTFLSLWVLLFVLQYKCPVLAAFHSLLHRLYIYLDRHVKILSHIVEKLLVAGIPPHSLHSLFGTLAGVSEPETVQGGL